MDMRIIEKRKLISLPIVLCLVLTACGGSTGQSTTTESTTTTSETTTTEGAANTSAPDSPPVSLDGAVNDHGVATVEGGSIQIEQGNFYFEPTYVEGQPGETIEIEVVNAGSVTHTFTIEGEGIDLQLDPDQAETVEVTVPESGNLTFFCRFHVSQGMQGAVFASDG